MLKSLFELTPVSHLRFWTPLGHLVTPLLLLSTLLGGVGCLGTKAEEGVSVTADSSSAISSTTSTTLATSTSSVSVSYPSFSLQGAVVNLTVGAAITPISFLQTIPSGGLCSLVGDLELPSGLTFDSSTCILSGTPTASLALSSFSIALVLPDLTLSQSPSVTFSLQVTLAPVDVAYTSGTVALTLGVAANVTPVLTGSADYCIISPSLPAGLGFSNSTCAITGTPSSLFASSPFRVVVGNSDSVSVSNINLAVNDVVPTLSYTGSPVTAYVGSVFPGAALMPTLGGGTPTGCEASPSLPGGLVIDDVTCEISGTPTEVSALQTYTVTVSNSGGESTTTIELEVLLPAPAISSVDPSSGTLMGNTSITISGSNFTSTVGVTLGGSACTSVNRVSDSLITCLTPSQAVGNVNLVVTNSDEQTASTTYEYIIQFNQVSLLAGVHGPEGSADGTGSSARFNQPSHQVKVGGYLYVSDNLSHTIRKIDLSDNSVTTFAGLANSAGIVDGIGNAAQLYYPAGIVSDGTYLYVAENGPSLIRRISLATAEVTTIAGVAFNHGHVDHATGTSATLNGPYALAIKSDNSALFVGEQGGYSIRRIALSGAYEVTSVAGSGVWGSTDDVGPLASFSVIGGLTYFNNGGTDTLYVSDAYNYKIRRVVLDGSNIGTVSTLAASTGSPKGLVNDGTYLYYTNNSNSLMKMDMSNGAETTAISGSTAGGFVDGDSSVALMTNPNGLAFNPSDLTELYFADSGNSVIRKVTFGASTTVSLIAGHAPVTNGYQNSTLDADGLDVSGLSETRFTQNTSVALLGDYVYAPDITFIGNVRKIDVSTGVTTNLNSTSVVYPQFIASDGSRYLYVASTTTLWRVDTVDGSVTEMAGADFTYADVNGIGSVARFSQVNGLAVVGTTLYVVDQGAGKVKTVDLADPAYTVADALGALVDTGTDTPYTVLGPVSVATEGTYLYLVSSWGAAIGKINPATNKYTELNLSGMYASRIATDGTTMYVVDSQSTGAIYKFPIATPAASTLLVGSVNDARDADGALASARFYKCYGMALGLASSNFGLYVSGAYGVRRVW